MTFSIDTTCQYCRKREGELLLIGKRICRICLALINRSSCPPFAHWPAPTGEPCFSNRPPAGETDLESVRLEPPAEG